MLLLNAYSRGDRGYMLHGLITCYSGDISRTAAAIDSAALIYLPHYAHPIVEISSAIASGSDSFCLF